MTEILYHNHHIIPKHMGGSNDPFNMEKFTVAEHAEAHKKLYEKYDHWQDRLAWQGLKGLISKEQLLKELFSKAGKKGSIVANKARWADPAAYKKHHKEHSKFMKEYCKTRDTFGAKNPCARIYEITNLDGKKETVKSLKTWCEARKFNYNTFNKAIHSGGITHGGI